MVNTETYQEWWQLHLRTARGDTLNAAERIRFDALRDELESAEEFRLLDKAREAREELRELERERVRLDQRRQRLDEEIISLEQKLAPQARQFLGVEE